MTPLWTTSQAAGFFGLKPHTLEKWRCVGSGPPFIRCGGSIRYEPEAVWAWLDSETRGSTSELPKGD